MTWKHTKTNPAQALTPHVDHMRTNRFFLARCVHAHTPARGAAVPFCMRRRTRGARLRRRRMSLDPTQPPANLHYSMRPARLTSRSKSQFGLTRLACMRAGEGLGMRYKQHAAGERLGAADLAGEGLGTGSGDDPCPLLRFEPRRTPSPATSLPRTHGLRHSAPVHVRMHLQTITPDGRQHFCGHGPAHAPGDLA